jgi:uncharacterized membrane protein YedE/YeeE
MKSAIVAFVVGLFFAIGLGVSGMTQPQKVLGFLDVFGSWDPSLLFVMVGAILVHFITYRLIRKRKTPILTESWHVPTKSEITPALIIGSVLFGVGWGLGGYCPGPVVTSLASFERRPLIFTVSMIIGMFLFKLVDKIFKINR